MRAASASGSPTPAVLSWLRESSAGEGSGGALLGKGEPGGGGIWLGNQAAKQQLETAAAEEKAKD